MAGVTLKAVFGNLPLFRGFNFSKQWQGEEQVVDLQVGRAVHCGVPRNMRTELWLSVLLRKGAGRGTEQYSEMLAKGQELPEVVAQDIEKDVHRTFPEVAKFAQGQGVQSLMNVLKAYAAYDPEVGYCQGMNFLAGLLLTYLPSEADAFGAFVLLMQDRKLRELYKNDLAMLQVRLWQVGRLMEPRLARHMEEHGALPVLYVSSWLLTAFASAFPMTFAARIMDVILTDSYADPMMKVALGILKSAETTLMGLNDMECMVDTLKEVGTWPEPELQELLTEALCEAWTPRQKAILEQVAGAESVVEAVARVQNKGSLSMQPGSPPPSDAEQELATPKLQSRLSQLAAGALPLLPLPPPPSSKVAGSGGGLRHTVSLPAALSPNLTPRRKLVTDRKTGAGALPQLRQTAAGDFAEFVGASVSPPPPCQQRAMPAATSSHIADLMDFGSSPVASPRSDGAEWQLVAARTSSSRPAGCSALEAQPEEQVGASSSWGLFGAWESSPAAQPSTGRAHGQAPEPAGPPSLWSSLSSVEVSQSPGAFTGLEELWQSSETPPAHSTSMLSPLSPAPATPQPHSSTAASTAAHANGDASAPSDSLWGFTELMAAATNLTIGTPSGEAAASGHDGPHRQHSRIDSGELVLASSHAADLWQQLGAAGNEQVLQQLGHSSADSNNVGHNGDVQASLPRSADEFTGDLGTQATAWMHRSHSLLDT